MRDSIAAITLFVTIFSNLAVGQCEKEIEKKGIIIYTCVNTHSSFKSAEASFTLRSNLSNFVRFLWDVPQYDNWQYKTIEPRILTVVDAHEIYYYVRINSPPFVQDRDLVIAMNVSQDSLTKIVTVTMKSIPEYLPKTENVVRVIHSDAQFTVKPINAKTIHVSYQIAAEPGGDIPAWLINAFIEDGPYYTFLKMKKVLDDHYTFNAFEGIRD